MVKFWEEQLKIAMKTSERRIKFAERHGKGRMAMDEKDKLKKQKKRWVDNQV